MGDDKLSTDELAIAGVVAPILRNVSDRVTKRRVKVYSRDTGETLREATIGDALRGLAEAYAIEHALDESEAKAAADRGGNKLASCLQCGLEFSFPKSTSMKPAACDKCRAAPCAGGCGRLPPVKAMWAAGIRSRKGKPWMCGKCAGRKRAESPEWKSKHAAAARRRAADPIFIAKIRARSRELAKDPEWREKVRRASTTPEAIERARQCGRKGAASMTREAMSENGKKGAAAYWAKKRSEDGGSDGR